MTGDSNGSYISKFLMRPKKIGNDQAISFPNNSPINTQVSASVNAPAETLYEYMLEVYNPSTVSALTVKLFAVETSFGGGTRDVLIDTLPIGKAQTLTGTSIVAYLKMFHGAFVGANLKLVFSNDTALGVTDGFTAYMRLKAVG
jgi:hypothetical protein